MEQTELHQPVVDAHAPIRLLIEIERLIIVDTMDADVLFSGLRPTDDIIAAPPQECRICSTCSIAKHSLDFSKTQWRNGDIRKCKTCQSAIQKARKIKKEKSKKLKQEQNKKPKKKQSNTPKK